MVKFLPVAHLDFDSATRRWLLSTQVENYFRVVGCCLKLLIFFPNVQAGFIYLFLKFKLFLYFTLQHCIGFAVH